MEKTGTWPLSCSSTCEGILARKTLSQCQQRNRNRLGFPWAYVTDFDALENATRQIVYITMTSTGKLNKRNTFAALVRRSPLSPTQMLSTSFCTRISLMGLLAFFSETCEDARPNHKDDERLEISWGNFYAAGCMSLPASIPPSSAFQNEFYQCSVVNANFSRLSWVGWNVLKNTATHSSVDYNYSEQAHQKVQKSHSRRLENSDSSCKHDVPPWLLVLGSFYSTTRTRSDWRRSSSC